MFNNIRNKCSFIGRLGQDANLKYTGNENPFVTFSLAVDERRKVDDEYQTVTDWMNNFIMWGRRAEGAAKILKKGRTVAVDAKFEPRSYEDDDGKTVYSWNFNVTDFAIVDWGKQDNNGYDDEDDDLDFGPDEIPF